MVDWCDSLRLRDERLHTAVASLLAEAGLEGDFSLHLLEGGSNNRIFRIEVNDRQALLKSYFYHPDDPRDRLGAEFAFSCFAWDKGICCLPQPLACNLQNRLGLYEFVAGRQLLPHEVTEAAVGQALNFYRELNEHKRSLAATALPRASEACFTLAEHLQCVERRVQHLRMVDESSEINRQAAYFIRNELFEVWSDVANSVRKQAYELGLGVEKEMAGEDRCLSPSDFGFHNAILTHDTYLQFIDFEYAGWDDPAKMVCDFFCQPAVPVPLEYFGMFGKIVASDLSEPEMDYQRFALLLPVYRIKWCCILLSDFLSAGSARRRFARSAGDLEAQKVRQLQKARFALNRLTQ